MATGDMLFGGRKIVASSATAERLALVPTQCSQVVIQAEITNTGVIGVDSVSSLAHADTARTGVFLTAGNSVTLPIKDLYPVYLIASVNGDGVTYLAVNE